MNRELSAWTTRPISGHGQIVELVDSAGRRIMLTSRNEGRLLADLHNRTVDDAYAAIAAAKENGEQRTTVADVEAMLVRVLVAALKELARGALPRKIRRQPVSTHVGKAVDGS